MQKTITLFKKRPIIYSIAAFFVIMIIYFVFFSSSSTFGSTITIKQKDFVQKLAVSGTVEASQTANLGFAQSGRIARIYAKVGEPVTEGMVIAKIENGDLEASLIQKQFALKREQANLRTKQLTVIPGETTLITQKYKDAVASYITSLNLTYLKIEEALITKADNVFLNANSVNPTINIYTESREEKLSIEKARVVLTEKLAKWKEAIMVLSVSSTPSKESINTSKNLSNDILNSAKYLVNVLSIKTANLSESMGYTTTEINGYRQSVNDAGQLVTTAASTFDAAVSALNIAQNSYDLEVGGSTTNDIDAQVAITSSAEADVMSAQAQLEKTIIRAPFSGIITKMDAKVGEIATSNTSSISINGNGSFVVKSNVPEVYISNLKVGNTAVATLDAYGPSVKFPMKVVSIDPAQTVVNGVSNYKTTLQFDPTDKLIMSGMTANVEITTQEIQGSFVVPIGTIFTQDGKQFIQIKDGDTVRNQEVVVGSIATIGEVNIVSGLKEGDEVVLNPDKTKK